MILIKNVLTSTRRQPELAFSSPPSMMSTQGTRQMEKPLESDSMAHDAFLDDSPYKDAKVDGKQIRLHQGQCPTSNPTLLVYAGHDRRADCYPRLDHYWLLVLPIGNRSRPVAKLCYSGAFQPKSEPGECLKFPQNRLFTPLAHLQDQK